MSALRVRWANAEDVGEVVALEQATPELAHWSEAQYAAMVGAQGESLGVALLVAEVEGCFVGFVAGRHLEGETVAELEAVAVSQQARRQGVADALVDAFCVWAVGRGASGAMLEVRRSNVTALAFYSGVGFRSTGVREDYYRDPAEDALVLSREL